MASWRTAYKRLAIGRMLTSFGETERALLRAALADVGVAKASIVAPAVERLGQWHTWLTWALQDSAVALQAKVSEALQALPRGVGLSPPGTRFRQTVLAAMPDIEAMELVERFFEVDTFVVGTDHTVAIFLAGCRECFPEWETQATRLLRRVTHEEGREVLEHHDVTEHPAGAQAFAHVGKTGRRRAEARGHRSTDPPT